MFVLSPNNYDCLTRFGARRVKITYRGGSQRSSACMGRSSGLATCPFSFKIMIRACQRAAGFRFRHYRILKSPFGRRNPTRSPLLSGSWPSRLRRSFVFSDGDILHFPTNRDRS